MRVAVIGLDCAAPSLVFDEFRSELPTIGRLIDEGVHGTLRSCDPPITVPAWACMASSRQAGELGVYGFRNRKDHSYDAYTLATASAIDARMTWDILGDAGKQSILLGVPPSFPAKPVNGVRVGCFLTPTTDVPYTYPASLKAEVERVSGGYVVDVDDFRTSDKAALLRRIYEKTDKHFAVARHLASTRPWDLFWMVEMGTDRIHHGFWQFTDRTHRAFVPGNPFEDSLREYYRHVDSHIAELLECFPDDTHVLVVSDHGAKRLDGCICLNEWLLDRDWLGVHDYPDRPTPLGKLNVDWSRTKAWGEGGYYGRVFLNVRGREPEGTIAPEDYEAARDELIAAIEAIPDENGTPIGTRAYRPEDLYREVNGVAPDLIVYFGDLYWRSAGTLGHGRGTVHTFENDTGPDDANHDWEGIVISRAPGGSGASATPLEGTSLFDVAPTILDLFGLEPPAAMNGRPFLVKRR